MAKERLNGYWTSKADKAVYIFVEKVYKKGYVTGLTYRRTDDGEVFLPPFKMLTEELTSGYVQGLLDWKEEPALFTEEQLDEFDRLTKLESSRHQMDRIRARLEYPQWLKDNNLTKVNTDAMHQELIKRGRW